MAMNRDFLDRGKTNKLPKMGVTVLSGALE